MGKLFKLRWSLLFPLSFQSCKSKDPSTLPESPTPLHSNSIINLHLPPPTILPLSPQSHPAAYTADDDEEPDHFRWNKETNWHIVSTVQATEKKKQNKKKTKKQSKSSKQRSRSSATSSPDSEWFSSSRTLSTDSVSSTIDGRDQSLQTISEIRAVRGPMRRRRRRRLRRLKCAVGKGGAPAAEGVVSPARLSRFCSIEGKKVRESFAVVKRSVEPFEDFKRSMVEMILEKEMVEVGELEELLRCFLSLNSRDHHGVIVEAFAEIYEAMFSQSHVIREN